MEAEDIKKDIKIEQTETETAKKKNLKKEIGGQDGPEPTRFGDWEKKGITSDF
ncbi:DUF1674 domain-containing protein [Pelagibacteraceae bacterium]|jgi:hypothetical protein|nr:DUF1674 domain-containing protein [Pelagibacteraceae bacterium]|tara:strand:+ start:454 stop:612 length:159 start_codon:yes stop_codon:yes gene_type:complete